MAAFGAGRFLAPTRIETRTERVDVATSFASWDWTASSVWTQTAGPVHRKTTRRTAPAQAQPVGCPECPAIEEEVVEEDIGPVVTTSESKAAGTGQVATTERHEERSEKIVERDAPRLMLGGGAGARFDQGASAQASLLGGGRVVGPAWLVVVAQGDLPLSWPPRGSVTANVAFQF